MPNINPNISLESHILYLVDKRFDERLSHLNINRENVILFSPSSTLIMHDERLPLWSLTISDLEFFHNELLKREFSWDFNSVKEVFTGTGVINSRLPWPAADAKFAYLFGSLVETEILNIHKNRKWKELNLFFCKLGDVKFKERSLTSAYAQSKADKQFRAFADKLVAELKSRKISNIK